MGTRYYKPGDKRGGMKIVPTKKFFMLIAAIAAIIVAIVLIVTLVPNSEKDKTIQDVTGSEVAETVPATVDGTEQILSDETAEPADQEEATVPVEDQTAEPTVEDQITEPPVADTQPADTSSYEMLQEGDTGSKVTSLQDRLIELGYLSADNNTGKYGPMTAEAVQAFQSANGLDADGIAGSKTQVALYSDSAKAKS